MQTIVKIGHSRLIRVVAALIGIALLAEGISGSSPNLPAHSQADVLKTGLKLWRSPGAIDQGAACATCHSPDGIELAVYNFSDADIKRRTVPHLGDANAQLLVDYIHALRIRQNIDHPRDPIEDRPLQPGGKLLPGETPASRDQAFGSELQSVLPTLFGKRIRTIPEAKLAESEVLKVDVQSLEIGIPFSRLSEDKVHGPSHASIAEWLPEIPPLIPGESLNAWYSAEDEYLANPSTSGLKNLLQSHIKLVNTNRMLGLAAISTAKYRALLVFQDQLRRRVDGKSNHLDPLIPSLFGYNAFWEVGEQCRALMGHSTEQLGISKEMLTRKSGAYSIDDQMRFLRSGWFWMGWLSDQGLFQTSHDDKTRLGMWLSQSLSQDGPYPIHNVFANVRRQAVVSTDLDSWAEPVIRRRRIWDLAGLRSFGYLFRDLPEEAKYREMVINFTANSIRMNLLLFEEELIKTKSVWVKISSKSNVKELTSFIKQYDPDDIETAQALEDELMKLIDGAKERNQFSPGIAGQ